VTLCIVAAVVLLLRFEYDIGSACHRPAKRLARRGFPIPRVGLPHEVANVTLFLATDEASCTTGSEYLADGGWFAGMRRDTLPCS